MLEAFKLIKDGTVEVNPDIAAYIQAGFQPLRLQTRVQKPVKPIAQGLRPGGLLASVYDCTLVKSSA